MSTMATRAAPPATCYLDAARLAAGIRGGEFSATEVVAQHLERIHRFNPRYNAVVDLHEEAARARAREADAALARGECWGPLHGVPVTVKDVYDVAGMRTTFGYPPLRKHVAAHDAFAVARLRGAGAVILGKTNAPLGSYDWQCWNPVFGHTRNPWDVARTPGGSSGGSAAAIAAGFSALELGSDAAGSIRVPVHFCGVVGMKPTEGRVSGRGHGNYPGNPLSLRHLCTYGPIARSVGDVELGMTLLTAPDPEFPDAPPMPFAPAPAREAAGLRIAWTEEFGGYPACAETAAALDSLARRLEEAGATVEHAAPYAIDGRDALVTWGEINGFETGIQIPRAIRVPMRGATALRFGRGPFSRGLRRGLGMNPRRYFHALDRRDRHSGAMEGFLSRYDAWLCPVAAVPAITRRRTGARVWVTGRRASYSMALGAWASLTAVTGNPVVVLPMGYSAAGLPIGVQVVGRRWDDAGTLAVARVIEGITGGFRAPPDLLLR